MRRSIVHLTAVLVAIGALSSALGSAAPPYQASASEPPTGLTAAIPEITLGPRPDRVPVSTPTPVPSPVRTVTPLATRMPRPAATFRPLPVPVVAAHLGLHGTHFTNPTGLDAPGHYSSAFDLALAATYLESHYSALVAIAATPAFTIPAATTHKAFALININKLLRTYPGAYGLKTGWTEAALGCLITTSKRGGHRVLAVMLGAPHGTAYAEMPKVLDYGFELLGVLPRPATS